MAKRKRLSPANPEMFGAAPETKSMMARAPIADVASEAATTAALQDVTRELREARKGGRMVLSLAVGDIVLDHIVRDRVVAEGAEMDALKASIAARGQQTPIEVLETKPGQYGLISGWRRCQAIAQLSQQGDHDGQVLALLRAPAEASDTYQAMVEENEIRVGLSYFERARIAAKAVEQGVFETEKAALLTLFASASRPKRSKIRSFLPLVHALDGALAFPHLIGERMGLRLSALIEADRRIGVQVRRALEMAGPMDGAAEQTLLTTLIADADKKTQTSTSEPEVVQKPGPVPAAPNAAERPTLNVRWDPDICTLSLFGSGMTPAVREDVLAYLRRQGHI